MSSYLVDFRALRTAEDVAAAVGCRKELLTDVAAAPDQSGFYIEHAIPKRNPRHEGKKRIVLEPVDELKVAQKALARRLEAFVERCVPGYPGQVMHGFVRGRGTRTNASVHVGAARLARADIRAFFRSITCLRVQATLEQIGIARETAELLAKFVTVDGLLCEGAPTSPLVANLYAMPMDEDMLSLAQRLRCRYSRYADDLAFSGPKRVPGRSQIEAVVSRYGFELAPGKYRITVPGQAHYVTGLSISAPPEPRAPRELKRRVRQELYYAKERSIHEHAVRRYRSDVQFAVNTIDGQISYLLSVEPRVGLPLRSVWEDILRRDRVTPRYTGRRELVVPDLHLFVDETFVDEAQERMAVGIVLVDEVCAGMIRDLADRLSGRHLADPFATGKKRSLRKKGLHFVDNSEDLRTAYIRALADLPLRGYVACGRVNGDPEACYMGLLRRLLRDRLARHWAARISIAIEEGTYPSQRAAEILCTSIVQGLRRGVRGPLFTPSVAVLPKLGELGLSSVDYLLAAFRGYANQASPGELERTRFERLRDKLRLVHDVDSGTRYWRKNPLPEGVFADGTEADSA